MMNPYEVLGVPTNATDEQIKNAYRNLARMYQPENFSDEFSRNEAARKMQELNDAYDAIIQRRQNSYSYNQTYEYYDVRQKINEGRLDDALTILDGIPSSKRDAQWHYLKGTIQQRRGWFNEAAVNFRDAARLDPGNREYREAYNNVKNSQSGEYRESRRSNNGGCSGCDVCSGLLCADCCCECMGGDLIRCC